MKNFLLYILRTYLLNVVAITMAVYIETIVIHTTKRANSVSIPCFCRNSMRYYLPCIKTLATVAMLVMAISAKAYHWQSPYAYCMGNPVKFVDPDGRKTVLFATKLPGCLGSAIHSATHTFIAVFDNKTNALRGYFAFGPKGVGISDPLEKMSIQAGHEYYDQDMEIINEYRAGKAGNDDRCKSAWSIEAINPADQEQFDDKVIEAGNSYEPIPTTEYHIAPSEADGSVNCNKGSYNLLKQAGVSDELLKAIGEKLPGRIWGWGQNMPWTKEEQYKDYSKRTWGE